MGGSKASSSSQSQPGFVYQAQDPYLRALYDKAFQNIGGVSTPTQQAHPYVQQGSTFGQPNFNMGRTTAPQQNLSIGEVTPGGDAYNFAQGITQAAGGAFGNQSQGGFADPTLYKNLYGLGSGNYQNQALGGAIQAGLGDINRNFQRNILPSINTGSALTNTSGGSRQGIAQGLAASDANRQASDFISRMYSDNFGQQLQTMLSANSQLGGLQGQRNAAQQGALGQAGQLAGLGTMPTSAFYQQQFAPLQALSSILGNPAILGGGSQSSSKRIGGGVFTGG